MPLAALLLIVALPQDAPAAKPPAAPPAAAKAAAPAPADTSAAIAAGQAAFKKHHFKAAQADFEKALDADPQSAAAAFYLGYTYYKLGEPSHRMNANKQKAKELFAKAFSLDASFEPVWGKPKTSEAPAGEPQKAAAKPKKSS